ncbi:uncharacterized protein LOC144447381 [Glandiceps talaboti]
MENCQGGSNRQSKGFHSGTGRRYGRQYAYMTYRPMLSGDSVSDCSEHNTEKGSKSLHQSKTTVENVASEYAQFGESSPKMKKKEIKKVASKVTSDGSHSGSGISSPSRHKEKNHVDKDRGHSKKRKGSSGTLKGPAEASNADVEIKVKGRTKKTGPGDGGSHSSRYETNGQSSERNWNSEGGRPKSSKKGTAKPNCDPRETVRHSRRQIRRKRAVSTSEKQEYPKQVKHGAKSSVASTSGSSSSTRHKSKAIKDSPRSSSSGPETQKSANTKKTRKNHRSKSSHRKSKDDNHTASAGSKSSVRKKTGRSKKVGSESTSSQVNPAVDSVASLPALCDSSDSESDLESRLIAEEYVHRCRYIDREEPNRATNDGLVYQMISSIMTNVVFGPDSENESDSSIESREDFLPELVPLESSCSSDSSDRHSDRSHSSLPSLSSDTNSDSDLSESSSGSHSNSSHDNVSAGAASWNNLPPLISDSNSEDSEHTAEEMSDMEEEEEFYRAAAEIHGDIEEAFFPFIQLPTPTNPLELIIQNRLQYTQDVMQALFENAILQMLALHPDLQGDQAPPAATQQTIDALPKVLILQKHIDDELTCAICQCEYSVDDTVNKLPCEHLFHPMCITAWLQKSGTCPVCRHILNADS